MSQVDHKQSRQNQIFQGANAWRGVVHRQYQRLQSQVTDLIFVWLIVDIILYYWDTQSRSEVGFILDEVIDESLHLLLIHNALGDGVGSCWIDLLGQVQEEVEITIFYMALLYVLVSFHVLFHVLLRWLVSNQRGEFSLLNNWKFVVLCSSMCNFDQQKLRLKLSNCFPLTDKGRIRVSMSKLV